MTLKEYVAALEALIAATTFVAATALSYEERPPTAGLIKGAIVFTDGSQLDFKEFLITQPTTLVIKYAYNYRQRNHLLFRYDNASDPAARNLSTYPSHKHVSSGISPAEKTFIRTGAERNRFTAEISIKPPNIELRGSAPIGIPPRRGRNSET